MVDADDVVRIVVQQLGINLGLGGLLRLDEDDGRFHLLGACLQGQTAAVKGALLLGAVFGGNGDVLAVLGPGALGSDAHRGHDGGAVFQELNGHEIVQIDAKRGELLLQLLLGHGGSGLVFSGQAAEHGGHPFGEAHAVDGFGLVPADDALGERRFGGLLGGGVAVLVGRVGLLAADEGRQNEDENQGECQNLLHLIPLIPFVILFEPEVSLRPGLLRLRGITS